jgi:hypothetical protein
VGLSDDQKAMLRLLAQRGEQGYEDIAALKGLDVEEVGAQVRAALRTLEEEGIPAPSIPAPPGVPTEEPPVEPRRAEPAAEETPPVEKAKPAPAGETAAAEEKAEPAAKPKPAPKAPRARQKASAPKLRLPEGTGPRAAIAAAVAVVVIVVVILLVSGGGGSGPDTGAQAGAEGGKGSVVSVALEKAESEGSGRKSPTYAALRPVEGSGEGVGIAIFGKVKKALALRVVVEGLEQTQAGESYTVWISNGPEKMLPLASTEVTEKGTINAQVEVPLEVLAYLASETFDEIALTRTSEAKLRASLNKATKAKHSPSYTGTEVLRGPVKGPIVGAQQIVEEEEEAAKKE